MVGNLDQWLIIRHELGTSSEHEQNLIELQNLLDLGQGLDSHPDRNKRRDLLKQNDLQPHGKVLAAIAQQPKLVEYGPSTTLLLARLLNTAGETKVAIAVLRSGVVRYPGDLWTNFQLATLLRDAEPSQVDESIRYFTAARALRPQTGLDLVDLLRNRKRFDEAEAILRDFARLDPESTRTLLELSALLRQLGKKDEARLAVERMIAPFREKIRREPDDWLTFRKIAVLLWLSRDFTGAVAAYREAARANPRDAVCRRDLGSILCRQGDLSNAILAYREAILIDSISADNRYLLAATLERSGDRVGEIAELREAIRIERIQRNPEVRVYTFSLFNDCHLDSFASGFLAGASQFLSYAESGHVALGCALAESGDIPRAIEAYTQAIRLAEPSGQRGRAAAFACLGSAQRLAGNLLDAVAAFREAIRLDPEHAVETRYSLGIALAESGDPQAALAAFVDAIQHEHLHQVGPFQLLQAIVMARRPDDAVAVLRRVYEQARHEASVRRAIELAIGQFEQLAKLSTPIPRFFRRSFLPNDLAGRCYDRRFFAASATIWSAGFASDAKLGEAQNRYNAACSAALAAADKGIDRPRLDESAKTRWRHQALEWLKVDLVHWVKKTKNGDPEAKALTLETLQRWKSDRDLAGVRDEPELAKLPEPERKEWRAFWSEVATLLKTADGN